MENAVKNRSVSVTCNALMPLYAATVVLELRGSPVYFGSGFLVDRERRLIVTAAHLVSHCCSRRQDEPSSAFSFRVFLRGADIHIPFSGGIFYVDFASDIALLQFPKGADMLPPPAELRADGETARFAACFGNPVRLATDGISRQWYGASLFGEKDLSYECFTASFMAGYDAYKQCHGELLFRLFDRRKAETMLRLPPGILNACMPFRGFDVYDIFPLHEYFALHPASGYSGGPFAGENGKVAGLLTGLYLERALALATPAEEIGKALRGVGRGIYLPYQRGLWGEASPFQA